MDAPLMKVGTLAKKTGLTIRSLHYYEEIGLLTPAQRSEKGYRLYGIYEVQRLQQILSLQQLSFSLEDIRTLLDQPDYSLHRVIELHMIKIQDQVLIQQQLLSRFKTITEHLHAEKDISIETFLQAIKATTMYDEYYTQEQLDTLKQRREELGEEGMQQAQTQWADLNEVFKTEMEKGTSPTDKKVQNLVKQMQQLIFAFTGGDPEIGHSLGKMYQNEGPEKTSQGAISKSLFEYIEKARSTFDG